MRVLFCSPALAGHTLHMLPLACALRARGHDVAWCSGANLAGLLHRPGFTFFEVGPTNAQAREALGRRWPQWASMAPQDAGRELAPRLFGEVYMQAMQAPLGALVDRWRPDLVVHDVMAYAAPLVCAVRGLPHISHVFGLPRPGDAVQATAGRVQPQWHAHGLEVPPDSGNWQHGHVDICPPALRGAAATAPVELCKVYPMAAVTAPVLGCPAPSGHRVLATFGTVVNKAPAFDVVLKVLAHSPDLPTRAALGPGRQTQSQAWPTHMQVDEWVDLSAEWPQCSALVSHGGAGTLLSALAHGVPGLVLPQGADNFRNAQALVESGAGLALHPEGVSPEAVRAALQRLHDEPGFRQRAQQIAREIAAMPSADDVAAALGRRFG